MGTIILEKYASCQKMLECKIISTIDPHFTLSSFDIMQTTSALQKLFASSCSLEWNGGCGVPHTNSIADLCKLVGYN